MEHYYIMNSKAKNGFDEVTEEEYISLIGDDSIKSYTSKVYKGTISIDDVPEELRSKVEEVVANRVARYGNYEDSEISSAELKNMIEEVL